MYEYQSSQDYSSRPNSFGQQNPLHRYTQTGEKLRGNIMNTETLG